MDWETRYNKYKECFGLAPTPLLEEFLKNKDIGGLDMLFPGDGYGRNGIWCSQRGARVVSVDFSKTAVAMALERAQKLNARYISLPCDLSSPPYPLLPGWRFDMVVSVWFQIDSDGALGEAEEAQKKIGTITPVSYSSRGAL